MKKIADKLRNLQRSSDRLKFWDRAASKNREVGCDPREVSNPPGVLYFENNYLWQRAVMEPISGRREDTPIDWFFRDFLQKPAERVLSICCGTGSFERELAQKGYAEHIDAFDASGASIEWASSLAKEQGLNIINYWVADGNSVRLREREYDLVISMAALHHIENLEHIFQEIRNVMKPGGLLFYDEYIGKNRMQWPEEVLKIVNGILMLLPRHYRVQISNGKAKDEEIMVSEDLMIKRDPTEAVRSEDILPLTERYFEIVTRKDYGGAILMPLFMNIVSNFDSSRKEDCKIMDFCIYLEKLLLSSGAIKPNGTVVVCRKT